MITMARSFTRVVVTAALLGMALLVSAQPVAAQGNDAHRATWMAGLGSKAAAGTDWGRLSLQDGVLAFTSLKTEWRIEVSAIKRAAIEPVDRLVVEGMSGEIYYVTILDARMEAESPRAALKIIQRALQASAARRER